MRFDNIIGTGPGQIPADAIIVSADLTLDVNVSGSGTPLHLMLQAWDGTNQTYNGFGSGVDLDNAEATNVFMSQIGTFPLSGATTVGAITVSVLPDVQAWQHGLANYGWVFPGWSGGTKTTISPSEATNVLDHPRLKVKWVPAGTAVATFRQGVNSYTGAKDTSIRKGAADADRSAVTGIFVDAEVTPPNNDPEQVLMRFDNIVGNTAGQIPANSAVQIAVLDLAGTIGNAMGDGGNAYAMLSPWNDTSTWNSLVNGISTDGVEAATTPTFSAGNPTLNPNVPGGFLTFEVTPDVQAWVSGTQANYGWAILPWPNGGDGWGFGTSESVGETNRPQLRVYYVPSAAATPVTITSITATSGSATIQFTGSPNTTYYVQRATTVTGTYTTINSPTTDGAGHGSYTDSSAPAGAAYYRISKNP
jgi:hypothetical protein